MGCGYACVDCGRCSGTAKPVLSSFCFFCGSENKQDHTHCASCGKALPGKPGINRPDALEDTLKNTLRSPLDSKLGNAPAPPAQ